MRIDRVAHRMRVACACSLATAWLAAAGAARAQDPGAESGRAAPAAGAEVDGKNPRVVYRSDEALGGGGPLFASDEGPRRVELSRMWVEPPPPDGALILPPGAGNIGPERRGWNSGRFRYRQGIDGGGGGFDSGPRFFPEGDDRFEVHLSERFAFGPMLGNNVDAPKLLAAYPTTLPEQLIGGRKSYASFSRALVAGPLLDDRIFYYAEAYDDRSAGSYLGASKDEVVSAPRYTLNLTWRPSRVTKATIGARYDAIDIDNAGLSAWYLESAGRQRRLEEATMVASITHQLGRRNEIAASYELVNLRDDATAGRGVGVPAHYNLGSYQTWGNYPTTSRRRQLDQRVDLHWSMFHDGVILPNDAHTVTLGAELDLQTRDEDQSRNGGFSFTDDLPRDAAGNPIPGFDEGRRPSWVLFSSDRGDELHAKTRQMQVAAYAKDKIQIGSALTLTPGVRFEHFEGGVQGGASAWTTNTVSPRLSAIWQADGWTTIYANAGRFYQTLDPSMYVRAREGAAYTPLEYWDWQGDTQTSPDPGIGDPRWQRSRQFPAVIGTLGDVKHPYADRLVAGVTRTFDAIQLRASLRYELRFYGDMLGIFDVGGVYDPKVATFGPGAKDTVTFQDLRTGSQPTYVIGNPEGARREYHSLNLSLTEGLTRWLLIRGSVTYTFDRGNFDGVGGLSTEWRDPSGRVSSYGNMGGFDTWAARLGATVDFVGFRAWIDYSFYSGQYFSRLFRVTPTNAPRTFVYDSDGRGGSQYPARHLVDLRLSRRVARLGGGELGAWLQVYNLLNSSTVTGFREPSTFFRSVRSLEAPREIHLGLRYDL